MRGGRLRKSLAETRTPIGFRLFPSPDHGPRGAAMIEHPDRRTIEGRILHGVARERARDSRRAVAVGLAVGAALLAAGCASGSERREKSRERIGLRRLGLLVLLRRAVAATAAALRRRARRVARDDRRPYHRTRRRRRCRARLWSFDGARQRDRAGRLKIRFVEFRQDCLSLCRAAWRLRGFRLGRLRFR